MSRIAFVAVVLTALASTQVPAAERYERKTGFVIPSQCRPRADAKKPNGPYDEWPAPHTTECALQDACIASGYGLWAEGTFFRFDEDGQSLALEYFKGTRRTSYNKVEVTGVFTGDGVVVKRLEPVD